MFLLLQLPKRRQYITKTRQYTCEHEDINMSQYLIHATHERINYVRRHLIPSMLRQGIKSQDITLYVDNKKEGLLKALITSSKTVKGSGTWHLQDDVIISSDFKDKTEQYDQGIVCGFCNSYSKGQPGEVGVDEMW